MDIAYVSFDTAADWNIQLRVGYCSIASIVCTYVPAHCSNSLVFYMNLEKLLMVAVYNGLKYGQCHYRRTHLNHWSCFSVDTEQVCLQFPSDYCPDKLNIDLDPLSQLITLVPRMSDEDSQYQRFVNRTREYLYGEPWNVMKFPGPGVGNNVLRQDYVSFLL